MRARNTTIRGRIASEHIVQFFDTDDSRAQAVAAFLAEGYALDEPLIVIARPPSWAAVSEELEALGVDTGRAAAAGMLIVKNADDTLRRLSRSGSPDPELFHDTITKTLSVLATRGSRVRAYGEMVDILAQRDELADALALESLWNVAAERVPIYLLCGYSAAHFVSTATHQALRAICETHSNVHQHTQDQLASWILTAAHNTSGDSHRLQH